MGTGVCDWPPNALLLNAVGRSFGWKHRNWGGVGVEARLKFFEESQTKKLLLFSAAASGAATGEAIGLLQQSVHTIGWTGRPYLECGEKALNPQWREIEAFGF